MTIISRYYLFIPLILLGSIEKCYAECENWVARVASSEGLVEIQIHSQGLWQPVELDQTLCAQDRIRTSENSRAMLVMYNQTYMRLDQSTELEFIPQEQEKSWLELLRGAIYSISRVPNSLEIKTPYVNAAIRGTEFLVRVEAGKSWVAVYEGKVEVSNAQGSIMLPANTLAVAEKGKAPVQMLPIPLADAVDWALYYPSIVDRSALTRAASRELQAIANLHNQGQSHVVLARLGTIPTARRNADYYLLLADAYLSVGRVDKALSALNQIPQKRAKQAEVKALKSLILLTKGNTSTALTLSREAVELDAKSVLARLVLSYALQANYDMDSALAVAQSLVSQFPTHARAWARLAELLLAHGEVDEAREAASKANQLMPELASSQSMRGFAELMTLDSDEAELAFQRALEVEPDYATARLGLGITLIRKGQLQAGREQLEIAALMNPYNSLIRSYLGKAYYEERRETLAAKELQMAKRLDPDDPTPWFYDAILKQTMNRHHDALENLEQAVHLNNNRAVYRSRLLLDRDMASRVVSMARIHSELGFEQTAINQSSHSLDQQPTNFSAHRFLFDSYRNRSRHEAARVSERLQTQLLQPINMNPVQPELGETDLHIISSESNAALGFNEFTPLFERNGVQFTGGASIGSNETLSDQAVISGMHDRFSYSLGQFYYESEGYRANNEQRHKVVDLFTQVALTSTLDLQFEYRRRKSEEGDLRLNFDKDNFSRSMDRELEKEMPRVGLHYHPDVNSDLIATVTYADRQEDVDENSSKAALRQHGYDAQVRYTFLLNNFNLTVGGGHSDFDGRNKLDIVLAKNPILTYIDERWDGAGEYNDLYGYANVRFPSNLLWTLGVSLSANREGTNHIINYDRVLPKLGLQWDLSDLMRVRMSAFKSVKRPEIFNETLEPTQIAAFNQVFDDFNGTISKQYGVAVDFTPRKSLFIGAEWMRRDLDIPRQYLLSPALSGIILNDDSLRLDYDYNFIMSFEKQREDHFRLYSYWTPLEDWSFSLELQRKRFRRSPEEHFGQIGAGNIPREVKTTEIPFEARYFSSNGLFGLFRATHVRQRVEVTPDGLSSGGKENFFILDASFGYRLPKRRGLISLDVNNLLDEEFLYQDTNIQNADPSNPEFIPDRIIQLRFTLNI